MGTVADKLGKLLSTKADIKAAIIEKGQAVADTDTFASYAEKILDIQTGAAPGTPLDPVEVYNSTRPTDWLPMPEPQDNEMYLLFHIPDGVSSLLAFTVTCTGSYIVALGTVVNGQFVQQISGPVTSGAKYEAELFADDYGNLTSDGMKQVMVKVSGTDILTWEPSTHSKKTYPTNFCDWNIVEISCNMPNGTKVACGNSVETKALRKLKYFSWVGSNSVTSMSSMFYYCYSLTAIPQLDTSSVTDMRYLFSYCYSLTAIPQLDTSSVTDMRYLFSNCYSLTAIPQLDTSSVTDMGSMFYYCNSLTAIPQLDTSSVTDMGSMFNRCNSLTAIPQLDTSSVTNMSYLFSNCNSLTAIPQLDTSSVTSMSNLFSNCYSLASLVLKPSVTGWAGYAISLYGLSLGHQALVDLFNSLPTITSSKALTLTGNPGVLELTAEEKAIATGKNWTLTL